MSLLSFIAHRSRRRALALYDEASRKLDEYKYDEALKIARKLRKLHFSGAYEIEGRVHLAEDRDEEAARVLREGVTFAPSVWINWLLLGSSLSELSRFDEALDAYDHAAQCEKADLDLIDLNRAVIASRREDFSAALHHLDDIREPEKESLRLKAISLRVDALRQLERIDEAEKLATRTLREWRHADGNENRPEIGEIALLLGKIRLARNDNRMLLRAQAIDWWRLTHHDRLLSHIRELRPVRSPGAHYFNILVHGKIGPESPLAEIGKSYVKWIQVLADTPEEGLSLHIELDPPEEAVELSIREANAIEPGPNDIKGVYSAGWGRIYCEED